MLEAWVKTLPAGVEFRRVPAPFLGNAANLQRCYYALEAMGEALHRASRKRRVAVKALLLDQALFAGTGNIYADEALFAAGVRPRRAAGGLTRAECERIATGLRQALLRGIETGGSSIDDYFAPDGEDGSYQDEHRVYGRTGEPCRVCGTRPTRGTELSRPGPRCGAAALPGAWGCAGSAPRPSGWPRCAMHRARGSA